METSMVSCGWRSRQGTEARGMTNVSWTLDQVEDELDDDVVFRAENFRDFACNPSFARERSA